MKTCVHRLSEMMIKLCAQSVVHKYWGLRAIGAAVNAYAHIFDQDKRPFCRALLTKHATLSQRPLISTRKIRHTRQTGACSTETEIHSHSFTQKYERISYALSLDFLFAYRLKIYIF